MMYYRSNFRTLTTAAWLMLLFGAASTVFPQESDIFPVPDSYKVEGIPPIKNSEVDQLFYDPSSIRSNLIWDADRKNRRLLVTNEKNYIYLLNTPLSEPIKLLEKTVPSSVKTNPDGKSFAFTDDHEDEDNYQLYLYDFKEKTPKKLVTLTGKDESIDSFVWSKSGDSLFYVRVDYDAKTSKLCRFKAAREECFPTELSGLWEVMDASGNNVLLKLWKASTSQLIYVYDIRSKTLKPIDEKGNSRKGFLINDSVFWTSEGNENCTKDPCVLSQNLKTGKVSQLRFPDDLSNINELKISPNGKYLLTQETQDGIDKLRVFRLKNEKIVNEIPSFISGSFVIWNTRWLSGNEIAYTLEDIGKPASIHSFNIESKKHTVWTKERLPLQLEDKVKPPEIIRWKSFDQREITGFIVRPKMTEKKSPVLIYVHGGPQVLDKPVFNSQDIQFASELGLATIHTNIRGSSGFGKEFMDADNKEKRGDAVKDIRSLIDWIGKQPDLDANRIYLRGGSYGGFIVLATALQEPKRIKGVIAEYPLVSITGLLSQSWIDEFSMNEYGDPKDEKLVAYLDNLSPLNNTDGWNMIPLFLTRGKLDARNPEKDVIDLKTQLQGKDSELWFIYANEAGHGFGGKYVTAAMYLFLQKQINKEQ